MCLCVHKHQSDCTNLTPQKTQYFNAQNTFEQLFDMGVIPIVNENDTLAVSVRRYTPRHSYLG